MRSVKKIYMGIVIAFLYAPIIMIILFSFSAGVSRADWGGFTLQWYKELLTNQTIGEALYYTVIIALLASVISTIAGTLAAVGISGMLNPFRRIITNLSYLPIINPDIVTGISLMILFVFMKLKLGFATMLIAHIVFDIPYVIFSVLPKLQQLNKNTYEAALDLGATPGYALRYVILPQIAPGILTGLLLAFTLSIDDFVISFFTTAGIQNLSIYIYSTARRGINPMLYALMSVMFIFILTLMLIAGNRVFGDNLNHNKSDKMKEEQY